MEESHRLYQTIAQNFPNGVISVLDKNLDYVRLSAISFTHSDQPAGGLDFASSAGNRLALINISPQKIKFGENSSIKG